MKREELLKDVESHSGVFRCRARGGSNLKRDVSFRHDFAVPTGVPLNLPMSGLADFYDTFTTHDRLAALAALRDVPVAILAGTRDQLCPIAMSRTMAAALPHADLHVFPGAGHMLQLERADDVSDRLVELAAAVPTRFTQRQRAAEIA